MTSTAEIALPELEEHPASGRRLRLAPFEEYMLSDDRAGWPMTFWIRLQFSQPLEVNRLSRAMAATSAQHPMLSARVEFDTRRRPYWVPSQTAGAVHMFESVGLDCQPPSTAPFDLTCEAPWRIWKNSRVDTRVIWLEMHHAACDGIGAFRAVDDLLKHYVDESPLPNSSDVVSNWRQVARRHRCDNLTGTRNWLGQWAWMLRRIAAYGITTPACLDIASTTANPRREAASGSTHPVECRFTSLGPLAKFRKAARLAGCTINDLVLRDLFDALGDVLARRHPIKRHRVRLFVPMDLRGNPQNECFVCNTVGMLHIDRIVGPGDGSPQPLAAVAREMSLYRRYQMGRAFVVSVEATRRLLGTVRPLLSPFRCGATSVLTNVRMPLANSRLNTDAGRLQVDKAVLETVDFLPPVRPMTPACFGLITYADELRLGLRFNPAAFPYEEADFVFARLTERLKQSVPSVESGDE